MKTDKTTVFDLFEKKLRYVVPLFQRGYVWNRENQWHPLWDDIVEQAAEVARHRAKPGKALHRHFLGAVVLNLVHTQLRQVPVAEIIDGQQRLTTLQVLLAAVRDETAFIDNAYDRDLMESLTANRGPINQAAERFKVWPTSALQEHVANVMEAGSAAELEARYGPPAYVFRYKKWQPARPSLVDAYLFFAECNRAYLDDDPEELPYDLVELSREERVDVLIDALLRNIQLVTIELDQEDDPQVIFETLNARGEPLTASDLVRNFVFLTATREMADVERLYGQYWRQFEESDSGDFWKKAERQGRLKRSRLDLFLFHYVVFRTAEEFKVDRLYQAFRAWWDSTGERSVDLELGVLSKYAKIYAQLLEPDRATRFGQFAHRLRVLDTTAVYPVVLWAVGELGIDSPELHGIIEDLESYFVRRSVCGLGSKSYSRLFLEWYDKLRDAGPSRTAIRQLLSSSQAESARWPSDDDFRRNLINRPLYQTLKPRRAQMILEALNFALRPKHAEEVVIQSSLTVEHVLPQYPSLANWPLEYDDSIDPNEVRERRERLTHALGNLTLLTQPLNASVSNGPYASKRPAIALQSLLPLNTYFQTQLDWDESAIVERGEALANMALKIWPGSDSAA